jgi:mono/diheme cytochrome c family protein
MTNKWIRRAAAVAAGLAAAIGAAVAVGEQLAERNRNRVFDVTGVALAVPADAAALERGRYLFASRGCADCHGHDGAGRTFAAGDNGLRLAGPDITAAPTSATAGYRLQDWDRAVRHGVKPDGRPLRVMPSEDFARWTDADLGALVAYVRSLPPAAAGGAAIIELPLPARLAYGFGAVRDAAEKIDHRLPPELPVPEAVTIEHGRYVAQGCKGCHGPTLAGGKIPGGPPDWPAAAKLTPGDGSALAVYADADTMLAMFKAGKRPDGSPVAVMPFEALRAMSEVDVRALHLYLQSLPKS